MSGIETDLRATAQVQYATLVPTLLCQAALRSVLLRAPTKAVAAGALSYFVTCEVERPRVVGKLLRLPRVRGAWRRRIGRRSVTDANAARLHGQFSDSCAKLHGPTRPSLSLSQPK